jgi:hypothetical protein
MISIHLDFYCGKIYFNALLKVLTAWIVSTHAHGRERCRAKIGIGSNGSMNKGAAGKTISERKRVIAHFDV